MTSQLVLLGMLAALSVILSVAGVLVGLPALNRSIYRYRLWAIRDELWDAMAAGKVKRNDTTDLMLSDLENSIRNARHQTLLNAQIARLALARVPQQRDASLSGQRKLQRRLAQDCGPLVRELQARRMKAAVTYMLNGSVTGWIARVTLPMFFAVRKQPTAAPSVTRTMAQEQAQAEFAGMVARMSWSDRRTGDQPLSRCV